MVTLSFAPLPDEQDGNNVGSKATPIAPFAEFCTKSLRDIKRFVLLLFSMTGVCYKTLINNSIL
jgi:hypothetical protein